MSKVYFLILSLACLTSMNGYAMDELQVLRLRPSYNNIYSACSGDHDTFKENMYLKVYQESIQHTVLAMSFSGKEISQSLHSKGITPALNHFLNQEVTSLALRDCFKDEDDHFNFVRNLIVIDSAGKAVGISATAVSFVILSKTIKAVFLPPLRLISPRFAGKLQLLTVSSLIAAQIYSSKDEYLKLFPDKDSHHEENEEAASGIIKSHSDLLILKAQDQILKIETTLKNQSLTDLEREYLLSELKQWKIIQDEFS